MTFRPVLAVAAVFILGGVTAFLVHDELAKDAEGRNKIAPTEATARHEKASQDPLMDMRFIAGERETNLKKFGMEKDLLAATLKEIRVTEEAHGEKMKRLLEDAAEPVELADALCGQTRHVRPRYGALRFLVTQDKSLRRPLNLQRVSQLERQDWAVTSPIDEVYRVVELGDDRHDDATLMGIAGIIAGKEKDVIERMAPWGRSLQPGGWSWSRVVKQNPGIEERVVNYFAMMHLAVEYATAEDGVCGD